MKNYKNILLILVLVLLSACAKDYHGHSDEPWESEIARLQDAIEPYKDFETAKAAGYDIQATEYRTQMGYHYLNASILDDTFEVEVPEVLIYVNDSSGKMRLVAVEYGIPIEDIDNPPPPPEGFAGSKDVWKVDTEFNLWTLHAWAVMKNPRGVFEPHNPILP